MNISDEERHLVNFPGHHIFQPSTAFKVYRRSSLSTLHTSYSGVSRI